MAEEQEEAKGGGSLKSILIGLASTIALGVGGFVTKQLTGEKDEAPVQQAAPVINIQNTQNQTQSAGGGKTVIIKEKEKAADPKPAAPVKKKEGDEFKEKPAQW